MDTLPMSLLKYQQAFLLDNSQLILLNWLRRGRKTSTVVLKIVLDCIETDSRKEQTDWVILARGDRQAFEIRQLTLDCCAEQYRSPVSSTDSVFESSDGRRRYNQYLIGFPHGSRIIILPSNLDTARAYSANTLLEEFSIHENSEAVYAAVVAATRGEHKLIIASTPKGDQSQMFIRLAADDSGMWSKHVVNVYEAVSQGLPLNIDEEKFWLKDPQAWAQEYELQCNPS